MGRTIDIMISICSHLSTILLGDIYCIAILLSNDNKHAVSHDLNGFANQYTIAS